VFALNACSSFGVAFRARHVILRTGISTIKDKPSSEDVGKSKDEVSTAYAGTFLNIACKLAKWVLIPISLRLTKLVRLGKCKQASGASCLN